MMQYLAEILWSKADIVKGVAIPDKDIARKTVPIAKPSFSLK